MFDIVDMTYTLDRSGIKPVFHY